jgi:low affinity Fe/Cu permease
MSVIGWAVLGPPFDFSDTWQLFINTGTTVATFLMIFVLQHSQNRDGKAIQAKLDELIKATAAARNELMHVEEKTEREVDEIRP